MKRVTNPQRLNPDGRISMSLLIGVRLERKQLCIRFLIVEAQKGPLSEKTEFHSLNRPKRTSHLLPSLSAQEISRLFDVARDADVFIHQRIRQALNLPCSIQTYTQVPTYISLNKDSVDADIILFDIYIYIYRCHDSQWVGSCR